MHKDTLDKFDELLVEIRDRTSKFEFPTYPALDRYLYGLRRKRLYIIGGRPGEWKSSILLNLAIQYAEMNKRVLFLSLEMSTESLLERMICVKTQTPYKDLALGQIDDEDVARIKDNMKVILEKDFFVWDFFGKEIGEVEANIKQYKPDIVFIDFLQMIGMDIRKDKERLVFQDYIRAILTLAKGHNLVVVLASQINRAPADRRGHRPYKEDMKGCFSGETLIYDHKTGRRFKIKDIYNQNKKVVLKTYNIETGEFDLVEPVAVVNTGTKECYEIILEDGKKIIASENTKLVHNKKWVKIKDLKVGDDVAIS